MLGRCSPEVAQRYPGLRSNLNLAERAERRQGGVNGGVMHGLDAVAKQNPGLSRAQHVDVADAVLIIGGGAGVKTKALVKRFEVLLR